MTTHILNVDDNNGGRYVKTRVLQGAGFRVSEAATGAEALRLIAAEPPALILLDVKLPDMSGYEICRRLKGSPATASIMVLQTSASFVDSQHRIRGLEEGADAYLTEPVQPEELVATVHALLRLRQAEMELRQGRDALEVRVRERTTDLEYVVLALQEEVLRRTQSEQDLREAYQFLQSTLDALSSYILVLDESGTILDINAAWQRFLAESAIELPGHGRGMDFAAFFGRAAHAEAAAEQSVVDGVGAVLRGQQETFGCEYACQDHSGKRWFFVRVARLDASGDRQAIVVLENITEIKQAEEGLRRQQEGFYQSEKLAAMGSLLASVAHELNNPLGTIQMQLDLLREEAKDQALQERLAEVQQATERCTRVVQSFLTLARRSPPQRVAVQLNAVVEAALQLMGHALHLDNVEVHQHLASDLPLIGADALQLQQVIVNLLLNAQQALSTQPETGAPGQVKVSTHYQAAQKRLILEVADTGPGIPATLHARIFEPFFTTKPVGVGTGLGLSVCRGIVEAHGGTLQVVSQPGQGACFRLELPAEAAPVPVPSPPLSAVPAPTATGAILIVDDEVGIARGLARLLHRDGHQVAIANNGRQALAMLQTQEYDLILCDLRMPELDGPGLYQAVRRRQPHLLSRFIFLTGDTLGPEASAFLAQVEAPHLVKPFSATDSRSLVRQKLLQNSA